MSAVGTRTGRALRVSSAGGESRLSLSELGGGWLRERQVHAELSSSGLSAQCVVGTSLEEVCAFFELAARERTNPLGGARLRVGAADPEGALSVLELESSAIPPGSSLSPTGEHVLLGVRLGRPEGLNQGAESSWVVRASWPVAPGPLAEEFRAHLDEPGQVLEVGAWSALRA